MPVEYVYKITVDDSDLQTTLKNVDATLSDLGNRTAAAFDKVGTSMGTGVKKAASEAKKALANIEKGQKATIASTTRTEKAYIKLLAAELKLAAGTDKAAQEFIKQAAAGARSADALAKLVANSTSLTQSQVQQAQTVAFLKNQIQALSGAMGQEGVDTEALTGRIAEYQAILERIISTKAAEQAATDASIASKKAEADAIAQATDEITKAASKTAAEAEKSEQAYKKLLAAELKLAAGSDKVAKGMVASSVANTQSVETLLQVVNASGQMSEAQITAAGNIAKLKNAIAVTTAVMEQGGSATENLEDRIGMLNDMLTRQIEIRDQAIQSAKEMAAAEEVLGDAVDDSAGDIGDGLGDVEEGTEKSERGFVKLLAAELKVAAGADQVTQALIKSAAATAQTGDALVIAVSQTENLSEAQMEHAVRVATLRETIQDLTAELSEEGADTEELAEKLREATIELEAMAAAQEAAAAAAQNQRAMADEAIESLNKNKASVADAQKEQAKQQKKTASEMRKANREFTKLAKSFPEIKQGLTELTGQYGTFKTVIGETGQATGHAQEELHQLFKDNPKFARELEILTTKYGKFTATVQRADFGPRMKSTGQQVRQLGFALQRMGIGGVAAFGEIFAALGPVGLAIGAIIVPLVAVTKLMKKLADEAVKAFKKITKEAFEAAKQFETTEAAFQAIFRAGADSNVVELSLRRVREESERLGVSLEEILPRIMPKVSTLEQAFKIAELIPGLAASAVDLGPQDALRSIIEGLAGDLVSLRKAFEIDVTGIRKAQEEFGLVEGLVVGLTAELEAMGLTFADQAGTINVKIGQLQQRWQTFKLLMGEPLVDAVKDQFGELFVLLDANEDNLHNIATMIGTIMANLGTKLAGGLADALNKLDPRDIERIANALGGIADTFLIQVQGIIGVFSGTGGIADFVEKLRVVVDFAGTLINTLKMLRAVSMSFMDVIMIIPNAIFSVIGALTGMDSSMGAVQWIVGFLTKALKGLIVILGLVSGGIATVTAFAGSLIGGIRDLITGARSLGEILEDAGRAGADAMEDAVDRINLYLGEYEEVTLDAAAATRELGAAGLLTADDMLALANALKELTDAEEDFLKTQEEINEKIADFARDAESKFQNILTDLGRDLLDAQIDNQRKLVDLEKKNLEAVQDIRRGYDEDVLAAAVELGDKETDIARKHGREMGEIESDLNKARLKIEQDYLDDLERMRAKFDFDMFEAFLANDAKRLAQLRRRQAFEEKEAAKERDRGLRDADDTADEEREARKLSLEQELEDARIANARAIRDLATALELQFAEQELNRKRDVEAQALANKRKEEDMRDSFDRQLEDYDKWWKERHRTTTEAIAEDLEKLQKYVEERNELLDTITGISEVAGMMPLEELREQTFQRAYNQEMIKVGAVGGELPGDFSVTLRAVLSDMDRASLENLFNAASEWLGQPTLLEQRAIDILDLRTERGGFVGPSVQLEHQQRVAGMSEAELMALIAEIGAELAGIEIPPPLPEGYVIAPAALFAPAAGTGAGVGVTAGAPAAIPPGFSFPTVEAPPQQQPMAGIFGATGAFAPTAPGAGFGWPPALPPEAAEFANFFLPGNLMPIPPTFGFDAETYFNMLDDQTEAQASAELEMRGEIADTVDLAALLAEERAALHANYLGDEVASSQIASDAQIEILEKTVTAQRVALAAIRGDPELQVDIDALETSIAVLEDVITRARLQQAAMAEETAQLEADAVIAAEEIKRDETEATTTAYDRAIELRLGGVQRAADGEVRATKEAQSEQISATEARFAAQTMMGGEFREMEYTAQTVAEEEMAELLADSGTNTLDMQYDWWQDLLAAQVQGINRDLRLMVQWLTERQRIWEQMQLTMPGSGAGLPGLPGEGPVLPGVGGTGDDDDDGGSGQATLEELRNMAFVLAQQLGMLSSVQAQIMDMAYSELVSFVAYLQELVAAQGYALGGGFLPNRPLLVGENEPELVQFNRAGVITPISAFMESPPSRLNDIGETNIDQSINMHNDFPDPRGLSPSTVAAMENIAARTALKVWSKRRR